MPGLDGLPVRIKQRIDVRGECWLWTGQIDRDGYAKLGGQQATHIVWALLRDELPPGRHLHHTCEFKRCVRPEHLEPTTLEAHNSLHKRACNHERTGVKHRSNGRIERYCKTCRNAYERERLIRKRGR
jgi:hypothetical protein